MDAFLKFIGAAVFGVTIVALLAGLFAYPTKWIMNWLFAPNVLISLFAVSKINIWQALALNFICGTLFKGSGSSSKKD